MSFLVRSLLLPFINPVSLANLSLRLQNNYSTSFRWLDHWFGTDDKFTAYRARVAASKAADRAKVEAEEDQRIEAEGLEAEKKLLARGGDQKPKNLRLGEEVAADGSESAPHNVLRMAGEAEARKRK
jgi:hypothetical protein